MKTIGDISRWLKGAGQNHMIELRFKKGEFIVYLGGCEAKSKVSLESALENALEELRRKENGAESMRTEKISSNALMAIRQKIQHMMNHTLVGNNVKVKGNAVATPPQATEIRCPKCSHLVGGIDPTSGLWVCGNFLTCRNQWSAIAVVGIEYLLQSLGGAALTWRLENNYKWTAVP